MTTIHAGIDGADIYRAQAYSLLAALLARPPSADLLLRLSSLKGNSTDLGRSLTDLGQAAAATRPADAEREFNRLFIGIERGELLPYASYYLTGFLQDRPLIRARADMARLGVARAPAVAEPEDHIAVLTETMAGLIDGRFGEPAPLVEQQRFFAQNLRDWAPCFFTDLERAASASFYRPVGAVGRLFMKIEEAAFTMTTA